MNAFVSTESIHRALHFHPQDGITTSFYLDVDSTRYSGAKWKKAGLEMLEKKKEEVKKSDLPEDQHISVLDDLRSIQRFLQDRFELRGRIRGLVILSSSQGNFFEVFPLARSVRSRIVVSKEPYLRSLMAVLDDFNRLMFVLLDHREAKLFEMFMGEIREHGDIHSPVRRKVKTGGVEGAEERRIERNLGNKILQHYREIGDTVLDHFRRGHFDALVAGIKEEDYASFSHVLHTYVKDRLAGRVNLGPKSTLKEINREILAFERELERQKDTETLERIITMVGNDEPAVTGLPAVLRSLRMGACQKMIVDEEYRIPGFACRRCGFLSAEMDACDSCGESAVKVDDLINEAVDEILLQSGEVRYIHAGNELLENIDRIGAFLRYRV